MSDSSRQTVNETPVNELCRDALEHYLQLSNAATHYNSLIPEAIAVYEKVREMIEKLAAYADEDSNETMDVILEAVENKLDEQWWLIGELYGRCEGCDGRKDGFVCPAKSFLETEVFE